MDVFSIFGLVGGLALFLYGMNIMGASLEKLAGSRLEKTLEKLAGNPVKGFLLGLFVTAVIQSSSATTVMVVGFVNSGIMTLTQSVGVIMGANVGTTVTAWILSLTGLESENFLIRMCKPDSFTPILAIIGVIMIMRGKNSKKRYIGEIFVGFAVLIYGMNAMSAVFKDVPELGNILTVFQNPIVGILTGFALTAIIQSSSASVGILQTLAASGAVSYSAAIPILLGQNIGACTSALLSSIGANKKAKQAAFIHLYFNVIGKTTVYILFMVINHFVQFSFLSLAPSPVDIAVIHSIYSIAAVCLFMPFQKLFVKLAKFTVRESGREDEFAYLDDRFFNTPSYAVEKCNEMTIDMAALTQKTLAEAIGLLSKYDNKKAAEIEANESKLDIYEDKLGSYLLKISGKDITEKDSSQISKLLHSIGDFERIGDHAKNILDTAMEIHEKKISFSAQAEEELAVITRAVTDILSATTEAFRLSDPEMATHVEPLEQVIDDLKDELKNRHIKRLRDGECTIEMGFVFSDLLTSYERISDHCSNIAVYIIQASYAEIDSHSYLREIKESKPEFLAEYADMKRRYALTGKKRSDLPEEPGQTMA